MEQKLFKVKIYTLSDANDEVFYVGTTICDIKDRLASHISEAKAIVKNNHRTVSKKNRKVILNDFNISAQIVDEVYVFASNHSMIAHSSKPHELRWIKYLLAKGANLCNMTNLEEKDINPQFIGKTIKAA